MFGLLKNSRPHVDRVLNLLFPIAKAIALCLLITVLSCDSESDPSAQADYISSEEEAKEVVKALYYFWEYSAKSSLPHPFSEDSLAVDNTFSDNLTSAHFTGYVKFSQGGSSDANSSWSYHSQIIDITSIFSQGNSYNDISFNGTLKYHDIDNYSQVCTYCFTCTPSGMQCYGSATISLTINTAGKLNVEFEYNGKKITDIITLSAKHEAGGWDVSLKNKHGTEFKASPL